MASTATAYRNSDAGQSGKERPAFKHEEIQEFFDTCPSELVPYHVLRLMHGMWVASESKDGSRPFGTEILFFKAVADYRRACRYKSDRTVRYNLQAARKAGFIETAYRDADGNCHHIWIRPRTERDKGCYRRVATYRLSVPLLLKWRAMRRGEHQSEVTPIRKPVQPTPPPATAPAAPLPERANPVAHSEHRSPERSSSVTSSPVQARKLTPREGPKLIARMRELMRGQTSYVSPGDKFAVRLSPDDPAYQEPMPQEKALEAACQDLGIPYKSARAHLKLCRWDFREESGNSS